MNPYEQADVEMGRRAQYEHSTADGSEPVTVGEMKAELLRNEGGSDTDLKHGLEIRDDSAQPAPMSEVDEGWDDFQERQQFAQESESAAWDAAADATEKAALHEAMYVLETFSDESEIAAAALNLASVSPPAYAAYMDHIEQQYDPEWRHDIERSVVNTLGAISQRQGEIEWQQNWAAGNEINIADAAAALDDLIEERGMSPEDFQRLDRDWLQATGQPLRTTLEGTLPWDRPELLREAAIASEASERGERLQRFAASFFAAPSTEISDGLVTKNGVPRDLPAIMFDPAYAAFKAEKSIRAEDEARASQAKPERDSADQIKYQLLVGTDERDWREGLSDDSGRKITVQDIAEDDPLSTLNVNRRNREIEMRKIANATGAKFR
jgi:hypothetical protein